MKTRNVPGANVLGRAKDETADQPEKRAEMG